MSDDTAGDWQLIKAESELFCSTFQLPTQILIKWICVLPEYLGTSTGLIGLGKNRFGGIWRNAKHTEEGESQQFSIYHMSFIAIFLFIFKKCCSMVQNHTVMLLMKSMKRIKIWTAYDLGCERWGMSLKMMLVHSHTYICKINVSIFFFLLYIFFLYLRQGITFLPQRKM